MAPDDLRTGIETASLGPSRDPRRGYLLVVRSSSSTRVPLPEEGEVIIGRGSDCGVLIDDPRHLAAPRLDHRHGGRGHPG